MLLLIAQFTPRTRKRQNRRERVCLDGGVESATASSTEAGRYTSRHEKLAIPAFMCYVDAAGYECLLVGRIACIA